MDVHDRIASQIKDNRIVLYMKGTPDAPRCGFSSRAVQLLMACGLEEIFAVDVLQDPEIREGIKAFSNWPTIPQLYIDGAFIGGSDIMTEMFQAGELQKALEPALNA